MIPTELCKELKIKEGDIAFEEEEGFRGMRVSGTLDFALIGVIFNLSKVLAEEKISIFVVSTYNTDYILVKQSNLERAISALQQNGHEVVEEE